MAIIPPDKQQKGYTYLLFKNVEEYRNITHLWCEVEDSLIRLQPFIDNSNDGIIITNGDGTVRAINHVFSLVSGLQESDVLRKSVYELSKQGLLSECSMMYAIERKRVESSVVKFSQGKETVVSSKPLFDKQGNPETLLESELFGYEAGAFTGAKKAKIGLFEIAEKGTILLDEIGDMPLLLQAKLLNVLQEKNFYRVGGTKMVEADARVLAATNQNLEQLIAEGKFRCDLYFRLNVIPFTIPTLRERKEDIAPLLAHFLEKSNQIHK